MKSIIRLVLSSLFIILLAASCKKLVPLQVKHIPKNASFVAVINAKSIGTKMLQNQSTLESILKSATGTDTSANKGKQEWEELQASGIDLSKNFYISMAQKDGGGITSGKGTMVIAAIGSLTDGDKLEKYLKKKMPTSEIRKEKTYSFTTVEGDNMIAWDKDLVIAMSYQSQGGRQMEFDSATGEFNFKNPVSADNNLKTEMENYFALKEDMSVAAIPEFRDLMQSNADASMWVNASGYMDMFPLPRVKELFQNTFSAYTLNFEDGKVVVDGKSYLSKQLRDIYDKYSKAEADMSLVEKYPSDKINGFFVAGMDPQMISDIVKFLELGGMADAQLTKMMGSNYTLQDLLKAFKGDMAFVASDFAMKPVLGPDGEVMTQIPNVKMLGNIAVGDKAQMNKLMDKMAEMKMVEKSGTGYTLTPEIKKIGMSASIDDKNIVIASNDTIINNYKSGTNKATIDKEILSNSKGKSVVFYMNLQSFINAAQSAYATDSAKNAMLVKAKETFKDMSGSVNKPGGKSMESHYELRFINDKENSLTSILKFAEAASKTMNAKREPDMRIMADSIPVSRN